MNLVATLLVIPVFILGCGRQSNVGDKKLTDYKNLYVVR
jgi:hypothetical protein